MTDQANPRFHRGDLLLTGHFAVDRTYYHRRPRGSRDWLFFLTISGRGRLAGGAGRIHLDPGQLGCYRPGQAQDYGTDADVGHWTFYWVHIQPPESWLAWLDWARQTPAHLALDADRAAVEEAFANMHQLASEARPLASELARNALERALLLAARNHQVAARGTIDPRIVTALDRIARHLAEPPSIDQLAHRCGLSASRFAHLFSEAVGCGPAAWLEQERMRRAASLLSRTGLGVAEIGAAVGYDDPAYFSARFKHSHGLSPRAWRQQHRPTGS